MATSTTKGVAAALLKMFYEWCLAVHPVGFTHSLWTLYVSVNDGGASQSLFYEGALAIHPVGFTHGLMSRGGLSARFVGRLALAKQRPAGIGRRRMAPRK